MELTAGNTSGILDLRPNTNVGTTDGQLNAISANYNAFAVKAERTYTNGLQFLGAYTWSKAMDILDGDNADIQDLYNPGLTYGPAGFNRTNNVLLSAVYELPFGPGKQFLNSKSFVNREFIARLAALGHSAVCNRTADLNHRKQQRRYQLGTQCICKPYLCRWPTSRPHPSAIF